MRGEDRSQGKAVKDCWFSRATHTLDSTTSKWNCEFSKTAFTSRIVDFLMKWLCLTNCIFWSHFVFQAEIKPQSTCLEGLQNSNVNHCFEVCFSGSISYRIKVSSNMKTDWVIQKEQGLRNMAHSVSGNWNTVLV